MTANKRIVLSSDHAAIDLRQAVAAHISAQGWEVVDIGPVTPESTHYPKHGHAAARLVASGDCRLGIIFCGTGQGIMMAANKVKGIRCGVCVDTFSARMIRQHNDAPSIYKAWRDAGHEGLHHVCILVDDMAKARKVCAESGAAVAQEGKLTGGGEVIYVDTRGGPGTMVEILKPGPGSREFFGMMRDAARNWDGSNPVRKLG